MIGVTINTSGAAKSSPFAGSDVSSWESSRVGIAHLAGYRFAGGRRTIAHWENFLLTEACGGPSLADGMAHPVHLFHVPIEGAGVTIADLFALAEAEGPDRVGLHSYDWEWLSPLREDVDYGCEGEIVAAERRPGVGSANPFDELVFAIELSDGDETVARVTNTWHIWRTA
ncbi:MAG: hypothetical protein ACI9C1_002393 [Candidatus Aldehydirespiratoraceae bacterium]|jgi:hypothetical protein